MTRTPASWLEAYAAAWRAFDLDAARELFAADVSYSSDPYGPPLRGRDAVLEYWRAAFAGQRAVELHVRLWAAEADAAAAEWWAVITPAHEGDVLTLTASLLLRFDREGRCRELHEHWLRHDGRLEPPARFSR